MVYTFYVQTKGEPSERRVDMAEEGYTPESWAGLDENQKDKILTEVFKEVISDLCDSGWYEGEPTGGR